MIHRDNRHLKICENADCLGFYPRCYMLIMERGNIRQAYNITMTYCDNRNTLVADEQNKTFRIINADELELINPIVLPYSQKLCFQKTPHLQKSYSCHTKKHGNLDYQLSK